MRLIDADALKENISKEITKEFIHWDNKLIVIELKTFTNNIIDNARQYYVIIILWDIKTEFARCYQS